MRSRNSGTAHGPRAGWSRRRLQLVLVAFGVLGGVVASCAAWSVYNVFNRDTSTPNVEQARHSRSGMSAEDEVASAPMPAAGLQQALAGELSEASSGSIYLPAPDREGPVGVATGFPRTSEGALAQLVEIDRRALESVSVLTAQQVIDSWAEPNGPTPQSWSGVQAVSRLLTAAGLPAVGAEDITVVLRPAMGLIKGLVGQTFVVPCVDYVLTVTATGVAPQRIAVADCQRMRWAGDRWLVASGPEPAPAPSVWPGTQASYDAGYRWLEDAS